MKKVIQVYDYAEQIVKGLRKGALLTTKVGDKVNAMTIGWGMLGFEWGKPIFVAYVRENRFTKGMLDQSGEFTVSIPAEEYDKEILRFCGSVSGRNVDKFAELNLTAEEPNVVSCPGVKELPLTLECKVVYQQAQNLDALEAGLRERNYPQDVDGSHPMANRDSHTAYYGQIVSAYIIE